MKWHSAVRHPYLRMLFIESKVGVPCCVHCPTAAHPSALERVGCISPPSKDTKYFSIPHESTHSRLVMHWQLSIIILKLVQFWIGVVKFDRSVHAENMKGFNCFMLLLCKWSRVAKHHGMSLWEVFAHFVYKNTVCNFRSSVASLKTQLPLELSWPENFCSSSLVISLQFSRHCISGLECSWDRGVSELWIEKDVPAKRNEPLFCSTPFHSRQGYCAVPTLWCLTAVHNCSKQHDQHLPLTAGAGNHPRQAAPACAALSQQLEQSPPLVLQLPEQVNALPLMQGLSQSPGNNFVKQRGILKCLEDTVNSLEFPEKCE